MERKKEDNRNEKGTTGLLGPIQKTKRRLEQIMRVFPQSAAVLLGDETRCAKRRSADIEARLPGASAE